MPEKTTGVELFKYKGKPLVRCGDAIYYGDPADKYIVELTIKSKQKFSELELADKVLIRLLSTDQDLSPKKRIVKLSEKEGLYLALDIADVWLSRALEEAK